MALLSSHADAPVQNQNAQSQTGTSNASDIDLLGENLLFKHHYAARKAVTIEPGNKEYKQTLDSIQALLENKRPNN